jgi:hypothetical protein
MMRYLRLSLPCMIQPATNTITNNFVFNTENYDIQYTWVMVKEGPFIACTCNICSKQMSVMIIRQPYHTQNTTTILVATEPYDPKSQNIKNLAHLMALKLALPEATRQIQQQASVQCLRKYKINPECLCQTLTSQVCKEIALNAEIYSEEEYKDWLSSITMTLPWLMSGKCKATTGPFTLC